MYGLGDPEIKDFGTSFRVSMHRKPFETDPFGVVRPSETPIENQKNTLSVNESQNDTQNESQNDTLKMIHAKSIEDIKSFLFRSKDTYKLTRYSKNRSIG